MIPLTGWYPAMAAKWSGRRVPWSDRTHWVHHHTVGGAGIDPLVYARRVADMHYTRWGVPGGYGVLVGTDGVLREMCGLDYQGVHSGTREWNRRGIGLAYQGDFRTRPPTDLMLETARELIAAHPLDQTYHRVVRPEPTSCPGDALIALLPLQLPEEELVSLPITADSHKEEIRHVQEMLGQRATGEWDFVDAIKALAVRSGTGDPNGQAGTRVNGRMYTHLLEEFIGRRSGGATIAQVRDLIGQHASNPDAHHE